MEHIVHELAKTDFLVYSYAADGTATFPTRVSPVLLESRVWIRGTGALMGLNNGVYYAGAALADWARERGCIWEGNHFGVGLRACTDAGWNYIRGRGKGENMMKTKTECVIVTKRRSGLTFNDIEEGELFKIGANIRVRFGNDGYLVWTSPDSGSADFRRTFNGSEGVNRVTRVEFEVEE